MTLRQSLMMADGTLELDYANVIIVDPGVQVDDNFAAYIRRVSGSSHLSKTMAG